jgi:hypothetical protein
MGHEHIDHRLLSENVWISKWSSYYLDGDDNVAAAFQEVVRVQCDDTGLVGLGNVRKHGVHHANEHAVLVRVASILDDRDDVDALLGLTYRISIGHPKQTRAKLLVFALFSFH